MSVPFRKITKKDFILFSLIYSAHEKEDRKSKIESVWRDVFKYDDDTIMDEEKINSLSLDQLKTYCRAIEAPHGVVTNGTETIFVRPGELQKHKQVDSSVEQALSDNDDEKERIAYMLSHYDNMVQHLSPEERVEYIRERQAEKEKFGANYVEASFDLTKMPESQRILFELSWQLDDIPDEHKASILKGKIPPEFREIFLEALPDSLLERYGEYFSRGRIPKVMVKAIATTAEHNLRRRNELAEEVKKEMEGEEERTQPEKKKKTEL